MAEDKLCIGLVFGGRSGEHEVSLASAKSIMAALDKDKYEIVPIGITKEGRWLVGDSALLALQPGATAPVLDARGPGAVVMLSGDPTHPELVPLGESKGLPPGSQGGLDVILPVLHGTYGEDGTIQGLFDLANIPYVGCGVLGSAVGMDKLVMKDIFARAGLPLLSYTGFRRYDWEKDPVGCLTQIEQKLTYPLFVKPANLGSSVGISKARNRGELEAAIKVAAEYDRRICIEQGADVREMECAVLGNDDPKASVVGEVLPAGEFYDYTSKYLDDRSQTVIPANLPSETSEEIRRLSVLAFQALDLSGLARVDFFLSRQDGQVYINEVNTLPGFTQISMYPKLWAASGLPYPQLLDTLIQLARERHTDRNRNRTVFDPNGG